MPILHFVETCMTQDTTEISRAPPMRHHGYKMARSVSDTYEICNCFILSCYTNVLIYRNIEFSKLYLRMLKLQQKLTLFWIFPRSCLLGLPSDMFSKYSYLIVVLFFFPPWYLKWDFLSDCAFSSSLPTCTVLETLFFLTKI